MHHQPRVFVAGHNGLLGRALVRRLRAGGYDRLILRGHGELDLGRWDAVERLFRDERPEYVFLAAGRVGGISANRKLPAELIQTNLTIATNVIEAAHASGTSGLLFFGSSCMYPRAAEQPLREDQLWSGPLEPTSQAYAVAKLAGLELCRAYASQHGAAFCTLIPATLYGPFDHFASGRAHVIPALIERLHGAARRGDPAVQLLGSGEPLREFLYVDDAAEAALFLMEKSGAGGEVFNAGSGEEVSILELAERIARLVGFKGRIECDRSAPDGAPRKLLDSSRLRALGWTPRVNLETGLQRAVRWYQQSPAAASGSPAGRSGC